MPKKKQEPVIETIFRSKEGSVSVCNEGHRITHEISYPKGKRSADELALAIANRLRAVSKAARDYRAKAMCLMEVASGYDCDDDEFNELESSYLASSDVLAEILNDLTQEAEA